MAKVKVPEQENIVPFSGFSHGLKFESGVSEDFKDKELLDRLLIKGYVLAEDPKKAEAEAAKKAAAAKKAEEEEAAKKAAAAKKAEEEEAAKKAAAAVAAATATAGASK